MKSENDYIMWLNSLFLIMPKQKWALLDRFGSAEAVYHASSAEISKLGFEDSVLYNIVRSSKNTGYMEKLYADTEKAGARFVSYLDKEYPKLLSEIPNKPIGYFIIGQMPESTLNIAMVGSRNCTEYGATVSYNLSKDLAKYDITVVSGMAEGIDSYAHSGAIDGGGKTVAVMGTGIDLCYPSHNHKLRQRIIENGCIISEYPPGMRGTTFTFPMRNRIISGLSKAVAVVEAAKRSGSLITADHALDQNRDVFAVPGNITNAGSAGANRLIKSGAEVLTSAEDIIEYYNIKKATEKKSKKTKNTNLSPDEKAVYDCMSDVPRSIDELADKTGIEAKTLQITLSMLELDGLIVKLTGQRYIINK